MAWKKNALIEVFDNHGQSFKKVLILALDIWKIWGKKASESLFRLGKVIEKVKNIK